MKLNELEKGLDVLGVYDEIEQARLAVKGGGFPEAPNDGKTYGRKNKSWAEVTSGGTGEESDPIFSDSEAAQLVAGDKNKLDAAYGWGDHEGLYDLTGAAGAAVGGHESDYDHDSFLVSSDLTPYLTSADAATTYVPYSGAAGDVALGAHNITAANLAISNWNTAYGWGNHASAGYLSSVAFADLTDYPADAAGALVNDGAGNLSWVAGGGGGVTDHGALTGLADDDHSIYALLAGRSGGQILKGGSGVTDVLKLQGTSGNGTATSPAIQALVGNNGGTTALTVLNSGNVGIGTTTPTSKLDVSSDVIRLRTAKTPATSGATGNQGDICWDADYIYVAVETNTWKRAALGTW